MFDDRGDPIRRMLGQQKRLQDLVSGGSFNQWKLSQERQRDLLSGGVYARWIEQEKQRRDLLACGAFAQWMKDEKRRRALFTTALASAFPKRSVDSILSPSTPITSLLPRHSAIADIVGRRQTVADLTRGPAFDRLIAASTMPRADWRNLLEGVRGGVAREVFVEAITGFDEAEQSVRQGCSDLWWVARLPIFAQVSLLVVVLQVLDSVNAFALDISGAELPPAYESGVKALFALAAALLAFISAADALDDDNDEDDEGPA